MPLTEAGFDAVCDRLGVGKAETWAVLEVETSGFGYQRDRRPKILFERHKFHCYSEGRFSVELPDISNASSGGYGASREQYGRLERAINLDRHAALYSASWGIGQVMGFNHQMVGYNDVEAFVAAMVQDEDTQLLAMASYIVAANLTASLARHDWESFAEGYNGPAYARNRYDEKLAAKFAARQVVLPDLGVRTAQAALDYLDIDPGPIDGLMGRKTRTAIASFQKGKGLAESGELDDATQDALRMDAFPT